MKRKYFLLSLLLAVLFFITSLSYAQLSDNYVKEEVHRFDYRRLDPNNLPPLEKYAQPKEQVFPLGYGTNHLNKITTGTGVWTELNPRVPRVTYIGLHFVNKDTGWACGQSGAVIKTTNGGDDWIISETPINNLLLKTHSYNGQIVLVTGYDGIILRSSDEGKTFEQVPSGVGNGYDLWGVQLLNDTLGWVCGLNQTLLKTTDAGLSWQPGSTGLNQHYWAVDFINEQYGMIACSGGKILKTTNGGNSWIQIQAGDTRALYTIDVIDSLHIAAAGADGKNVYSSDGGTTWISNPDIPVFSATNCIDFIDSDTGYTVQDVYNIRKTTNRGQNWFGLPINMTSEWHIQLLDDGTGYSCGEEVGGSYALNFFKRTNGVENWSSLFLNINWSDVFFVDEQKGFFISSNVGAGIYKTEDGGISYQKIENAPSGYDLLFLDSLTGFIAGTHKTTDGGETWYQINAGGGIKVFFVNDSIGWSIDSHIYKTTNQGENWVTQLTLPADYFTGIFFVDTLSGWATSRYIWQTTDGGSNWIQRSDIPLYFTRDIYFTGTDTGFVAEGLTGNDLYVTIDGGLNWQRDIRIENTFNFNYFPNKYHWISNGGINQIWETTDNGTNWIEITQNVPSGFNRFQAPREWIGYAIDRAGLILKYEDTSYVPIELISFEGKFEINKIILNWQTATELNNEGFVIQKSIDMENWNNIGFVEGKGTSSEQNNYSFEDINVNSEKNYYRLKQIDFSGEVEYSKLIEVSVPLYSFYLYQNFPNPFNSSTIIKYIVQEKTVVKLNLYSINGELVKEILKEEKEKGIYNLIINLNDLATGVYFYRVTTDKGYSNVKKLILLK
jgi:photosystem II stability/assembly factor-like uncharacterized protein